MASTLKKRKNHSLKTRISTLSCGRVAIYLLLGTVIFSRSIAADIASNAPHVAEGNRGLAYVQDEKYIAALRSFKRSYKLKPTAFALFNMGMCYKALLRYVESIDTLKAYIDHPKADAAVIIDARKAIDEMESLIGHVVIAGLPEGAKIKINGTTDIVHKRITSIRLNPNNLYVLRIEKTGFEPLTREISAEAGASLTLSMTLNPQKVSLKVTCDKNDSVVHIDEQSPVPCPVNGKILPGRHIIRATSPDRDEFIKVVVVDPGGAINISAQLENSRSGNEVDDAPWKKQMVLGGASGVLGLSSAVVAAVYGYKYSKVVSVGTDAAKRLNSGTSEDREDDLNIYNSSEKRRSRYKRVIVGTTILAGALLSSGAALLGIGLKNQKRKNKPIIGLRPEGLTVSF